VTSSATLIWPSDAPHATPGPVDLPARILAATLSCIGRWGLAKTTLDDVARQARCSRATVYRVFPGGKEALVTAVARAEVTRVSAAIVRRLDESVTLEDLLATGLAEAARQVFGHPALTFLLAHEPESVVPWLAFQGKEALLAFATALVSPHLERHLAPDDARRAAEWAVRILHSFCLCPNPGVDLTDEASAREFVTTFMLPALLPSGSSPDR
jgi:AcrR family transcriptional regulator